MTEDNSREKEKGGNGRQEVHGVGGVLCGVWKGQLDSLQDISAPYTHTTSNLPIS